MRQGPKNELTKKDLFIFLFIIFIVIIIIIIIVILLCLSFVVWFVCLFFLCVCAKYLLVCEKNNKENSLVLISQAPNGMDTRS